MYRRSVLATLFSFCMLLYSQGYRNVNALGPLTPIEESRLTFESSRSTPAQ